MGSFMIVDSRRGITEGDEALLDWAAPPLRVHVLLSKADKLNRSDAARSSRETKAVVGDRATAQLFSVPAKTGIEDAREYSDCLARDCSFRRIKNPDDLSGPPGQTDPVQVS